MGWCSGLLPFAGIQLERAGSPLRDVSITIALARPARRLCLGGMPLDERDERSLARTVGVCLDHPAFASFESGAWRFHDLDQDGDHGGGIEGRQAWDGNIHGVEVSGA